MSYPKDELAPPDQAVGDDRAFELLRLWFASDSPRISARLDLWPDPAAWGLMLGEVARELAIRLADGAEMDAAQVLERIRAGLTAELAGGFPGAIDGQHSPGVHDMEDSAMTEQGELHHDFIEAVARQMVDHPAAAGDNVDGAISGASSRHTLRRLLQAAERGQGDEQFSDAVTMLRSSPRLLSSLFQNLDLLPPHDVTSDGVAMLIHAALDG